MEDHDLGSTFAGDWHRFHRGQTHLVGSEEMFPEAEAWALVTGWAHSAKVEVDTGVHEELR